MMMKCFSILLVFFLLPFPSEGAPKQSRKKNKRVVDVDFDDELHIKGKLLGPSIFTLHQKKNLDYGRLIKPRKNFLPEMRETLSSIK